MANWRDKNQNIVQTIAAGGAATQLTNITAITAVTLANGETSIPIPAGALEVGDALRLKGIYHVSNTAGLWNVYIDATSRAGNYMFRQGVGAGAQQTTEFDILFTVPSATTLTGVQHNAVYAGFSLATAAYDVTINDISTANDIIFSIHADGTSNAANTFDLLFHQVEIIKAG